MCVICGGVECWGWRLGDKLWWCWSYGGGAVWKGCGSMKGK